MGSDVATPEQGGEPSPRANPLARTLAARLREARGPLVARWLERIVARVTIEPARVFPTDQLLDHVPILIDGIADFLERPEDGIDAESPVAAKAIELGALRYAQGFDAYEILKEHEILTAILFSFLGESLADVAAPVRPEDVAGCWQRVSQAVELIRQTTMTHFLRLAAERVREREERLRRFNRMVSHELKNRVGAIRGAASLLTESWIEQQERARFVRMILENAVGVQRVLTNLEALSRLESDARQGGNVLLPQAAAEAARQLRDAAQAHGVTVQVADDLPPVEVDAAAVELCLSNYISNAIKYRDPASPSPWVRIESELRFVGVPPKGELVVRVRDNGLGVPPDARTRLFEQFYRAHGESVTGAEGSGLGLSIVRDTVESLGGRAWASFPDEGGSVFA
nr:ATP-binding protein [Candidatus Eremiobacteraeota bacterium]